MHAQGPTTSGPRQGVEERPQQATKLRGLLHRCVVARIRDGRILATGNALVHEFVFAQWDACDPPRR